MNAIHLVGIEEKFQRACVRLVQLFNDEANVTFNERKPTRKKEVLELSVIFDIEETDDKTIFVKAGLFQDNSPLIEKSITLSALEFPVKKVKKQAVLYTLLTLLEDHTGIEQPWGVLTGIRPTKLYHSMRRSGKTKDEIHEELEKLYLLRPEKIELLSKIVDRQLTVVPDLDEVSKEVSVYIGIPFCPTMCAYCTFPAYAINGKNGSVPEFLEGLHYELEKTGEWLRENKIKVSTIYYGGGTPTSITAEEMDALYEHMYEVFPGMDQIRELTVEAGRPDTITPEKIDVLKKWKVDRISVNPQSFTNETLKAIGRHHSVEETVHKYHMAYEQGLTNINMDLIIGLPGEGLEEFQHTLDVTGELLPTSLTVHTLSYKRASQMTKYKEKYKVASREEVHEMMKLGDTWMAEHGYAPYYLYRQKNILGNLENVGYALPGHESIYNIMIMEEAQTIIGLGCGAASKWVDPETGKIDRFANPKEPQAYIENFKDYTHKKLEALSLLFKLN
ncbi:MULTISPECIES: coproporphyrinogen III oxidase [Bacillaceae]|uniref:Coproporphyrinogen III oxidase n=1 Tax=Evansella alkalicola TaxID=745819 RepID=A0ABS6JRM1_9BACI|nr:MULTISPECIES: coproporphyrinogen III oxidase [Bacillaceae]MBU9720736.1 coproporphyrinogen III oxidase [Bacillus alkalicola]